MGIITPKNTVRSVEEVVKSCTKKVKTNAKPLPTSGIKRIRERIKKLAMKYKLKQGEWIKLIGSQVKTLTSYWCEIITPYDSIVMSLEV